MWGAYRSDNDLVQFQRQCLDTVLSRSSAEATGIMRSRNVLFVMAWLEVSFGAKRGRRLASVSTATWSDD